MKLCSYAGPALVIRLSSFGAYSQRVMQRTQKNVHLEKKVSAVDITALLSRICALLQLGEITSPPERLTGGALHQNWKITTARATYVIKKLNHQIAQKPGIREKYEQAEQIAFTLNAMHIPAVAALKLDSHFIHAVDGHLCIVYPFVRGKIISPDQLQLTHAEIIGQLFAAIHACQLHHGLSDSIPHYDVFDNDHWIRLIERYNNPELSSLVPTLLTWNDRYQNSISRLNQETLISHRDLHYSNVLWDGYTPHVIDWESVGYTNPLQEIIGYALEWAGITRSQFNKELFTHLIRSYKNRSRTSHTSPEDAFFGWLGNSVMGWTEFNLRRAKEDSFDFQEQQRGKEVLEKTMIPCLSFIKDNVAELLGNIDIWNLH